MKWEYDHCPTEWIGTNDWDTLGKTGWELAAVSEGIAYFKRPICKNGGRPKKKVI